MIYGPYQRKRKVKAAKLPRRYRRGSYKARPDKLVVGLRIAFGICLTVLAAMCGRMLYWVCAARTARGVYYPYIPTIPQLAVIAALAGSALLLLYLLERLDHGKRRN